jgi:hemerythrin-like domain-containing protein
MEEIKPLKRSKELAPLSREHHNGLLFAWKIKHGLANGTSIETLCNYTRWFWTNHIKPHFKEEEKVLAKFLPEDNALVKQMFREHAQIRDLIISLDKEPDLSSLQLLAEFINNHIRFEERQLFAYAEQTLTPEQLNEIYKDLPNELQCDTDPIAIGWKDEFWVRK